MAGVFWRNCWLAGKSQEEQSVLYRSDRTWQVHQGSETTALQALLRNILAAGWQPMLRRSGKCCMGMRHRSQIIRSSSGNSIASVT